MSDPTLTSGVGAAAAYAQTATGVVLLTTPFWANFLYALNIIAGTIAAICGAIVGVIGVWRVLHQPRSGT